MAIIFSQLPFQMFTDQVFCGSPAAGMDSTATEGEPHRFRPHSTMASAHHSSFSFSMLYRHIEPFPAGIGYSLFLFL